jgi:glutathione-regulated potassium-efflux system ancillary protein KefC
MSNPWALFALWVGLALATLLAIWLKVATALSEIVVGTIQTLTFDREGGVARGGAERIK